MKTLPHFYIFGNLNIKTEQNLSLRDLLIFLDGNLLPPENTLTARKKENHVSCAKHERTKKERKREQTITPTKDKK